MRHERDTDGLKLTEPEEFVFFDTETAQWPKEHLPFLLSICEFKATAAADKDFSDLPLSAERINLVRRREHDIQQAGRYARFIGMILEDDIAEEVAAFLRKDQ